MRSTICFLFCLTAFLSCKKDPPFDSVYPVNKKAGIGFFSYGSDSLQVMDIYLPANRNANTRTVVFIHGGGWNKGDKTDFSQMASLYADSGINAITVNYRLADSIRGIDYNVLLLDIESAILALKKNSKLFGVSFDHISLIGTSAGGHLALMYAYKKGNIERVVAIAAPTDLNDADLLAAYDMRDRVNNMIGSDNAIERTLASPIFYNNTVPTWLYHGKSDLNVPYMQSVVFYDKIKLLNYKNRLVLFDNTPHAMTPEALTVIETETIKWIKE